MVVLGHPGFSRNSPDNVAARGVPTYAPTLLSVPTRVLVARGGTGIHLPEQRIALRTENETAVFDLLWGGRLASLVINGQERIVTSPPLGESQPELRWGSYLMAPWAGRVAGAMMEWHGQTLHLPANMPPHSIHGLVCSRPTELVHRTAQRLTVACKLDWALGGEVRQSITLRPGRLEMTAEITAGASSMPLWAGWHPFFRRPEDGDVELTLKASGRLEVSKDLIPTGQVIALSDDEDLREGKRLSDSRLDLAYVNVVSPALIRWPDLSMRIEWRDPIKTAVVFTPPYAFCVEPQSAWPDALHLASAGVHGTGLIELPPGQTKGLAMRWRWSPLLTYAGR